MPFAITGGRYAPASISAVGTKTITVGTTPFVQADFNKPRLLGLWSNTNLITNSGFDTPTGWTLGAGVSISGGVLNCTGTALIASQATPTFIAGRTYSVSISYNKTAGTSLRFGTGTVDGSNVVFTSAALPNAAGTVTFTFTATANTSGFYVAADGSVYSGTLDNFTVIDNTLKGITWARRWVSTSQVQLERQFFDPATGATVSQVVGDQVLVSKDFAESVVAGLAVSGRVVSITDTATFGVDNNPMGVCLYDENKLINATFGMVLSGGLTVFGKLDEYATDQVSSSVDIQSTVANAILCNNAAANFCGYGGRWESSVSPSYFIGGNAQGTAGYTIVLNGVETPNDLLTNAAGGNWARNPERHQLVNCYSITSASNAIMRRWGNGVIRGGRYKVTNGSDGPISIFGSDAAGTYTVAASPGTRAVVLDMGGTRPALVRSNSSVLSMTFNFTNLITTDFRVVWGAGTPLVANTNSTNTFRFSDTYTGLQPGTVGVILDNSGAVADSVASSGTSWSPSLLRRTCVGATVTVNATSWTYGFKDYGFQPVSGTISPTTYDLGTAGSADNVTFGGVVTQIADTGVTLTLSQALALSSKFTASATGNGTLTVTANATYDEIYDFLIAWNTSSVALAQFPSISSYPITFAGTALNTGMSLVINAGVTLSEGAKFKTINTTGSVTNNGTINGSYTDASGTRVTIRTSNNLPLSTYLTINGVPQAWQTGQTGRNIFVQSNSQVRIYAHAYGYQPAIFNITGNNPSDYVINLIPETNVDTTLNTTIRDTITAMFSIGVDAQQRLFLSVTGTMSQYTPDAVLNALHYFIVTQGSLVAQAATAANSVAGFSLIEGGFIIRSPGFYGKVADSVTSVDNNGIYIPLYVEVDPSVYVAMPTYTPVEKNSSGIILFTALWTKQTSTLTEQDKNLIKDGLATESNLSIINEGVKRASLLIPHTGNIVL